MPGLYVTDNYRMPYTYIFSLTRFELFSATVDSLVRQREHGVDIMISLMKTLAYTRPIPG